MSILFDKTTGYWTSKTQVEGKDKRVKLRKIRPDEARRPIPDDVLALASPHECKTVKTSVQTLNATGKLAILPPATEPTPLHLWLDRYLVRYRRDRAKASVKRMDFILALFKQFAKESGIQTINAITVETIEDYVEWRYGQSKKPLRKASVHSELKALSGVFTAAIKVDRIAKNPVSVVVSDIARSIPKDKRPKYLDPKQVTDFLRGLDNLEANGRIPQDYADLARVMLYSGIRLTAAMHMRYDWITPDWVVQIPITTDEVPTKTKTGYQAVLVQAGREVIERRRQQSGGIGRVFPEINRQDSVQWFLGKLGINPHQLRHSFGTACVDSGVSMQVIQHLMGHADMKTTAIYAQLRDKTKLSAVDKIQFGQQLNN